MPDPFLSWCEALWREWLAGAIDSSVFADTEFDPGAAPEPYIDFDAGANPLVALTTNPGATMPHQRLAAVRGGKGPLSPTLTYAAAAEALGAFYQRELGGQAAGRRIKSLRRLAGLAGYSGVLQVEAVPFHSPSLPGKTRLLRLIADRDLFQAYGDHARAFLQSRPIVIVSAVSSRNSLGPGLPLSPWAAHLARLAGLVPESARFVPLVARDSKTTCAALVTSGPGAPKALVLMMGGNHLPAEPGLRVLSDTLRLGRGTR